MTEQEWLTCTAPTPMLNFLRGKVSVRKLRLFAVACCRLIWEQLVDERSRRAVQMSEQFVDGLVRMEDLRAAHEQAGVAAKGLSAGAQWFCALAARMASARRLPLERIANLTFRRDEPHQDRLLSTKSHFLHDILGALPFRRPAYVKPTWLAWNNGTVVKLAQAIYDERILPEGILDNGRLAILADALEEADCIDQEILSHCRQQGQVHVRGCWVIDLLLGKV